MALVPRDVEGAPSADLLARATEVVSSHLAPTPLIDVEIDGVAIGLKLESFQPTGAFKVRGALCALDALTATEPGRAVVACSAGNHGLGVAYAAERFGVQATVVVPTTASPAKLAGLRRRAVELVLHGETYEDAEAAAQQLAAQRGARFLSPYDDPFVIAGQATLATEVIAQRAASGRSLDHLVVGVGGGGLAAGCILALEGSRAVVHGAHVVDNAVFVDLRGGRTPDLEALAPTIADGLAGGVDPASVTLEICAAASMTSFFVDEPTIRATVRRAATEIGIVVEGSAAVAIAAALEHAESLGGEVVAVVSGRNIDPALLAELMSAQAL